MTTRVIVNRVHRAGAITLIWVAMVTMSYTRIRGADEITEGARWLMVYHRIAQCELYQQWAQLQVSTEVFATNITDRIIAICGESDAFIVTLPGLPHLPQDSRMSVSFPMRRVARFLDSTELSRLGLEHSSEVESVPVYTLLGIVEVVLSRDSDWTVCREELLSITDRNTCALALSKEDFENSVTIVTVFAQRVGLREWRILYKTSTLHGDYYFKY
jgi:hypothetical protein